MAIFCEILSSKFLLLLVFSQSLIFVRAASLPTAKSDAIRTASVNSSMTPTMTSGAGTNVNSNQVVNHNNFPPMSQAELEQLQAQYMQSQPQNLPMGNSAALPSSPPEMANLRPSIHFGRCPELQPTLQEKLKKAQVITKCLENTPIPDNITRETIEMHRELVAACALREEGWFEMHPNASSLAEPLAAAMKAAVAEATSAQPSTISSDSASAATSSETNNPNRDQATNPEMDDLDEELYGYSAIFGGGASYNYEKAKREIRSKRLHPEIEQKVLQFHANCQSEAQHKYTNPVQIIAQIQLYQACMDYFISDVCQIQVQI